MEVMHVVGNRPQFIKLAPVSRELQSRNIKEIIIHTGQHYDKNMSDVFFQELGIPKPDRNLNVGSGSHAQITAKAMIALEKVMVEYRPKVVMVYGDTNSTLAAALVAVKLNIPVIHIESGPRTGDEHNPEECNRVVVDHLSSYLCAPDKLSVNNLKKEGINDKKIFLTGDVMYDEFLYCASKGNNKVGFDNCPKDYILLTWHRQENTNSKKRMENIMRFLQRIPYPIIFPIHPRTKKMMQEFGLWDKATSIKQLNIIDPVGYKEMVYLMKNCKLLISDSGGASKEASFVGKKCIYILNLDIWPELREQNYIVHLDVENKDSVENILQKVIRNDTALKKMKPSLCFGDGNAAGKIVDIIEDLEF